MKFNIPLQRQDLLRSGDHGAYRVEDEYSIRELKTALMDTKVAVQQRGSVFVLERGFDVLFSVLELFNKDLPGELKETALSILCDGLDDLIRNVDVFTCSSDAADASTKTSLANRMKMLVYLLCQLVELIEADSVQKDAANLAKANKTRKKKVENENWDWDAKRLDALTLIFRLLNLNISALFDPPIVEEELVNLIGNCIFRILENPSIGQQRFKDVRAGLGQVLGTMVAKYNYGLSCRLKIVQSLKHFEHLATPMAEAVEKFVTDFQCRGIVMDIVREITRLDVKELSRDTSGTRAFSLFLVEITERIPDQMRPCLSLLQFHLDGESYMLRKSILAVFTEIVIRLFSTDNLDEASKTTRDQYLDCIEDHVHDVHAHVRSSVLQAWSKLCTSKAIPLNRQLRLLKVVVGRLRDRSSNVRKQAVQLLTLLLQCNPYNATLPVAELKEEYEKEKAKLEVLRPLDEQKEAEAKAAEKLKQWGSLEKSLQEYLDNLAENEEEMEQDEDEDKLWENASPGEVHERIRHHLMKLKFGAALSLLTQAKEAFPIFKKLESVAKGQEGDHEKDNNEGDDDEDDQKVEEEEDGENASLYKQLRTIFFLPLTEEAPVQEDPASQVVDDEITRQDMLVTYLKDSLNFATELNEALPTVCTLLGSKQVSDVQEAISFFVAAFEFGIFNAMMGVRKMLSLIFSRESAVQNAVVAAYKRLYIEPAGGNGGNGGKVANAVQMVRNLTALITGATVGDLAGLEELIGMLVTSQDLDKNTFQVMWQFFTNVMPDVTDEQARAALILLGMVASVEPNVVVDNIAVLVEHGLAHPRAAGDLRFVHDTCLTLLKVANPKAQKGQDVGPMRLPPDHDMFVQIEKHLIDGLDNTDDDQYIPMAQQAISAMFKLSDMPDEFAARICKKLVAKIAEKEEEQEAVLLRRMFFVVGHIAVCQLNHLDVSTLGELKRRSALRELKAEKDKSSKNKRKSKRRTSSLNSPKQGNPPRASSIGGNPEDDDMGCVGAEADDAEAEFIRNVCEKEVVSGENVLSMFVPMIREVCLYPENYPDPSLRSSASLALAKFMLVSSEFCDENLQLFFTVLERSLEPTIRANLIIAAGDLSFRYPNPLEPWTPRMYACLRDDAPLVRSNTITVLTHLILNDMIKVKGQISDMALCIVDEQEKIANMAKLFFTELARKGNSLYNVMPDIVSRLSDPEAGVDEERFRDIMKYIISLIDKDKHLESLVEKLCHRFHVTTTERQWRDLAFCLSIFNYNEKAAKKFMDNYGCFTDKLHEDSVYEAVCTILTGCKKLPRQELKQGVEEVMVKIEEARAKCVEDHTAGTRARQFKKPTLVPNNGNGNANANAGAKRRSSRRSRRKTRSSVEESSEDEEEEKENVGEQQDVDMFDED